MIHLKQFYYKYICFLQHCGQYQIFVMGNRLSFKHAGWNQLSHESQPNQFSIIRRTIANTISLGIDYSFDPSVIIWGFPLSNLCVNNSGNTTCSPFYLGL